MDCKHDFDNVMLVDGYKCLECDEYTEGDDGPLYECSSGTVFTRGSSANENHQCPECNKFGAKQAEHGCPACQHGELESMSLWFCGNCDTYLEEDDPA